MSRLVWAVVLAMASCTPALAAPPPPVPIESLAELPALSDPVLSPDGTKIMARITDAGRQTLAVYTLSAANDQPPKILPLGAEAQRFSWAGDGRVLLGIRIITLFAGILPIPITRLLTYDLASSKITPVQAGAGLVADDVIYTDPAGAFVLLSAQKDIDDSPSVWRVDLATGKGVEIQKKKAGIWSWFADSGGAIRGGISYRDGSWQVYALDPDSGELRKSASGRIEPGRESVIDGIYAFPGSKTGAITTNEPTGRFALYEYDLTAQTVGKPIFEHPEVDVTSPQISPATGEVEGVYYEDDKPRVAWLKPELKQLQGQIDKVFPDKINRILSLSRDRNVVLLWSGSADDPGAYYTLDRKAKRMNAFAAPYESLVERRLAPVKPVRYQARDGLGIPAYLTLPPGREAKGLPLIVMPHGGPFARTSFEFDPLVQLLATRGYAVLQPNFRGSTGYGRDFVEKGYGEWGKKMQDDLDDGVQWLSRDNVIDPKRVCMVGGSYGGYAALWAAVRNPDIYRCAVSVAGVTDIGLMLKYDGKFLLAGRYFKEWRKRVEGDQKRDLGGVSPLQHADQIKIPVLIAHGEQDTRVPVDQGHKLVASLKARNALVQSAFYPAAGHNFGRSEDVLDFMKRVEAFLEVHNPADGVTATGPRAAELVAGKIDAAALLAQSRKKPTANKVDLRYLVTWDGRVTSCSVTKSSGVQAIDKAACATAEQQFQYRPALAADGARQEGWLTHSLSLEVKAK